jgi:hypothetical protein
MAILTTGNTFVDGNQVTATKLNLAVTGAFFVDGQATDGITTYVNGTAISVKDGGITAAKLTSTSVVNGDLFIGSTTGFIKNTLSAGNGIAITNAAGAITVSNASLTSNTQPAQDFFVIMDDTDATGKTFQKSAGFVASSGDITFPNNKELTAGFFKATDASGSVTAKFYKDGNTPARQILTNQKAAVPDVTSTTSISGSDMVDEATVLASIQALETTLNLLLSRVRAVTGHGLIEA